MAIFDLASHPFEFVTVDELADHWRVPRARVMQSVTAGELAAIQLGPGTYRIRKADALEFERRSQVSKKPASGRIVRWPAAVARIPPAPKGSPPRRRRRPAKSPS